MSSIVPPPWTLVSSGFVWLLAPPAPPQDESALAHPAFSRFSGFGALIAIDYTESNAGPYRELLYIPGAVSVKPPAERRRAADARVRRLRGHLISRIFVTTAVSRDSGHVNWGIPKEQAEIVFPTGENKSLRLIDQGGETSLEIHLAGPAPISPGRRAPLALPFSSLVIPHTLVQLRNERFYHTSIRVRGSFVLTRRPRLVAHTPEMEGIASRRILLALRILHATIHFPPATIYRA